MPPPKKGAKAIEEDFSDVPTLPELNSLIFTMQLEFRDKEKKQQVYTQIKEQWKDRVRVITREDIIDYGRKKLTIAEDEDVKNVDKVAKAASEKLFEQFVTARREKRDRIAQLNEEAKAKATEENPNPKADIDPNAIDCFFQMPDYPNSFEEAKAFNRHKYALNALIRIEEKPTVVERKTNPELDEEGQPIEGTEQVIIEEEPVPEANRVPEDQIKAQRQLVADLKLAVKHSAKNSAIRTFAVINKDYNHRIVDPVHIENVAESDLTEEQKGFNSIKEIAKDIAQTLEKTASNLIKYQNFKKNAYLIPLKTPKMQQEVESRLDDHKEEDEIEPVHVEEVKAADKSKAKDDKNKAVDKSFVKEEEIDYSKLELLNVTQQREWNPESYKSVVKDLPEDKKSIAGLLSACVINI